MVESVRILIWDMGLVSKRKRLGTKWKGKRKCKMLNQKFEFYLKQFFFSVQVIKLEWAEILASDIIA